jgi:ubiquinone/menaquinone biosynthesis C-methylase UbiE
MFWFNKNHPSVVFMDIRKTEKIKACDGRTIHVNPDIVADFRNIPFPAQTFYHVIFDPPHLRGAGKNGWMAQKYGALGSDWREVISEGFHECMRVLKPYGTLIFKWNEHSIKVSEVIKVIGVEPLYGHRTLQSSKTIWMAFLKEPK